MAVRIFIIITILILSDGCNSGGKGRADKVTVQKNFDQFGRLVSEVSIKNGVKHGPTRNYYDNGKLHSVVNYENGSQHGETVWYYENGKPYQVTLYVNDEPHGIQKKYYQSGRLMAEVPFRNGKQLPGMKEYTEAGKLIADYPVIVFNGPVRTEFHDRFILKIHLSNNSKEVLFHQRVITNTGDTLMSIVPIQNGIGEIVFFVARGRQTEADIVIVAKTKTRLRNDYITEGGYHVKIVNE